LEKDEHYMVETEKYQQNLDTNLKENLKKWLAMEDATLLHTGL